MIRDPLRSPATAVVFAQALTGLGHLRVTHALYHGLPAGVHTYLLNSQDEQLNTMHRLMSIHPSLRRLMEVAQSGWIEDAFAFLARRYFRHHTDMLSRQLQTVLDSHVIMPKTLLIVATHTFLGHQIAAMKDHFARTNRIQVVLVVVVTDDSPQHVWAVGGADIIVVPSAMTKRNLEAYHRSQRDMSHSAYIVDPYMVSPRLGAALHPDQYARKVYSLHPDKLAQISVSIPISGAAVQLSYFDNLIANLDRLSDRFKYHIISKDSSTTANFLNRMIGRANISLHVSASHREVVEMYEAVYMQHVMSLEITKPSEQAFKALCDPKTRGGVILLFSDPVGRQERDNLKFLARHGLIPSRSEHLRLWKMSRTMKRIDRDLLEKTSGWRGLLMPLHSDTGAQFILWCLHEKVFLSMVKFTGYENSPELSINGVETFWKQMSHYLESLSSYDHTTSFIHK